MSEEAEISHEAKVIFEACPAPCSKGFIQHYITQAINSARDKDRETISKLSNDLLKAEQYVHKLELWLSELSRG